MVKALGIDLGERRIGLAVSHGSLATPHGTVERSGDPDADRRALAEAAAEVGAEVLVVGHPRGLDGRRGDAARRAEREATALGEVTGLAVELHDERLTTVEAERALADAGVRGRKRRGVVDQAAATVMLQSWLDSRRST